MPDVLDGTEHALQRLPPALVVEGAPHRTVVVDALPGTWR